MFLMRSYLVSLVLKMIYSASFASNSSFVFNGFLLASSAFATAAGWFRFSEPFAPLFALSFMLDSFLYSLGLLAFRYCIDYYQMFEFKYII